LAWLKKINLKKIFAKHITSVSSKALNYIYVANFCAFASEKNNANLSAETIKIAPENGCLRTGLRRNGRFRLVLSI
jgi:hypothetical protein